MDTQAFFTPEIIEAAVGLVALILVTQFPQYRESINAIAIAIVGILVTLIGSQTAHRISIRQEQGKIEVARIQASAMEGKYPSRG